MANQSGDFKQTVHQASKLDRYPIPRIQDLFATLAGGKTFTKLDMSQAYQLDEGSQALVTINTLVCVQAVAILGCLSPRYLPTSDGVPVEGNPGGDCLC